jgi:protein TonB
MEANEILSSDLLDLLFEDRNKAYGAYELRKTYNRRILIALSITAAIFLIIFAGSFLAKSMTSSEDEKLNVRDVVVEDLKQKEPEPELPPPPPPKQEPPPVETVKFTPPVIKPDEEVKEPPPPVQKQEEAVISTATQEGEKDKGLIAPEPVVENTKQIIEEKKEDPNQVFTKVEVEASYAGDWPSFLRRNLNPDVPAQNGAPPGSYTVVVQFIVDKEGNVSDIKPVTSHGYGMEDEAVRAIKKAPKWTPAIQNGRQVKAYRKQPITFIVPEE